MTRPSAPPRGITSFRSCSYYRPKNSGWRDTTLYGVRIRPAVRLAKSKVMPAPD